MTRQIEISNGLRFENQRKSLKIISYEPRKIATLGASAKQMDAEYHNILVSGWLGFLDPALVQNIFEAGRLEEVPKNKKVFEIGTPNPQLYCVLDGAFRMMTLLNAENRRFAHLCGPGFWFGEDAFAFRSPAVLDISSATDATTFVIHISDFEEVTKHHPFVWKDFSRLVGMNMMLAISVGSDLMIRNSDKRIAATILRLAGHRAAFQQQRPITKLHITKEDLAAAANLSRNSVTSILSEFSKQGIISKSYSAIEILDSAKLEQMLQD